MKMKLRIILPVVGAVGAIVAMMGTATAIHNSKKLVYVEEAATNIPAYSLVTKNELKSAPIDVQDALSDGYTSESSIIGHYTSMSIAANTQIQNFEVGKATTTQQLLASLDPQGLLHLVAASVPAPSGFNLHPGDQVIITLDVAHSYQNVTVLSTPSTKTSFGITSQQGDMLVAMPYIDYLQAEGKLSSANIVVPGPNEGGIPTGTMQPSTQIVQQAAPKTNSNLSTQPQSSIQGNNTQSPPQYFSPPKGGNK